MNQLSIEQKYHHPINILEAMTDSHNPLAQQSVQSLIRQEVIPNRNYVKWTILQGENIDENLSLGIHEFSLLLESDDNEAERVELTLNIVNESEMKKRCCSKIIFMEANSALV